MSTVATLLERYGDPRAPRPDHLKRSPAAKARARRLAFAQRRAEDAQRYHDAHAGARLVRGAGADYAGAESAAELLQSEISDVAACRSNGQALASWIRSWAQPDRDPLDRELVEWADREHHCHQEGTWGVALEDGRVQTRWEFKCGHTHLCQWEIRQEQSRLLRRYARPVARWCGRHPTHHAHYAVLTIPNVPQGELEVGKAAAWSRLRDLLWDARVDVSEADRARWGFTRRKQTRPAWRTTEGVDEGIAGMLATQEDPLSTRDESKLAPTWNIHLNVILLTRGWLDYGELRAAWGHDVEIRLIDDPRALARFDGDLVRAVEAQIGELLKYIAKGAAGESSGFRSWGPAAFREWIHAQKGRRRVRSYGVLHRRHDENGRLVDPWGLWDPDADDEAPETFWCGFISWSGSSYQVALVSDDNFRSWGARFAGRGGSRLSGQRAPPQGGP